MINNNLFDKIIFRIAKELNLRKNIRINANKKKLTKYLNNIDYEDTLTIDSIVYFSKIAAYDIQLIRYINYTVWEFIRENIDNFLEKNNIYNIFLKNLSNHDIRLSPCHNYDTINEYINTLKRLNYTPFSFFKHCFSWRSTNEGFAFWMQMHIKYQIELIDKLFNSTIKNENTYHTSRR